MDLGSGNLLYQAPHGTFTATLVDQNPMTAMPSVMQVVTFQARRCVTSGTASATARMIR